jgi:hypothetical protein
MRQQRSRGRRRLQFDLLENRCVMSALGLGLDQLLPVVSVPAASEVATVHANDHSAVERGNSGGSSLLGLITGTVDSVVNTVTQTVNDVVNVVSTSVQSLVTTAAAPISPSSGPTEQPTPGVTLVVEVPLLPTVNVSVGETSTPTSSGGGSITTPIPVTIQIGGGSTATPIPVPVQVGGGSTSSTPPPVAGNEGAPGAINVPASTPAGNETTPPSGAVPAVSATSSQGTPTGLAPSLGLSAPAIAPPAASSANAPSLSLPTGAVAANLTLPQTINIRAPLLGDGFIANRVSVAADASAPPVAEEAAAINPIVFVEEEGAQTEPNPATMPMPPLEDFDLLTRAMPFGNALGRPLIQVGDQLVQLHDVLHGWLQQYGPWPWLCLGLAMAAVSAEMGRRVEQRRQRGLRANDELAVHWFPSLYGPEE